MITADLVAHTAGRPADVHRPGAALILMGVSGIAALCLMLVLPYTTRLIAMPMTAMVWITLAFVCVLWYRDAHLPLFEVGTICLGATMLYCVFPLLGFMAGGMQWTIISDSRLLNYDPTPAETGGFAWRHVLYMFCLAATYLVVRGSAVVRRSGLRQPSRAALIALVLLAVSLTLYFHLLQALAGVSFSPAYDQMKSGAALLPSQLPYFVQQISNVLAGMQIALKQALLLLLLSRWSRRGVPLLVALWLGAELVLVVTRMGGRSEAAFLLLTTTVLFHRFVRPFGFVSALTIGVTGVAAVLLYGVFRDFGNALELLGGSFGLPLLSGNNEFQALFATSYDLFMRRDLGILPPVPLAVYFSEILLLIPSQFLPFQKWDPSIWYLEIAGLRESGFGAMFGVISQGIVGLDWVELALRGCAVGAVFGWLHRWYVSRAGSFWVTLFYVFVCVWSYYTYRAGSFYMIAFVVFQFMPMLLLVWFGREVIRLALSGRAEGAVGSRGVIHDT